MTHFLHLNAICLFAAITGFGTGYIISNRRATYLNLLILILTVLSLNLTIYLFRTVPPLP